MMRERWQVGKSACVFNALKPHFVFHREIQNIYTRLLFPHTYSNKSINVIYTFGSLAIPTRAESETK